MTQSGNTTGAQWKRAPCGPRRSTQEEGTELRDKEQAGFGETEETGGKGQTFGMVL